MGEQQGIAFELGEHASVGLAHGAFAEDLGLLGDGIQLTIKFELGQQVALLLGQAVAAHQAVGRQGGLVLAVGVIDEQGRQLGGIPRHLHPLIRGLTMQKLAHGG